MNWSLVTSIVMTGILISCNDMLDKTGIPMNVGPTDSSDTFIDGVTSATGQAKFRLNSGVIYSDSLEINFFYMFSNGFTWAKVIDTEENVIVDDTLNIPPLDYSENQNNRHVLKPLKPETTYRLIMDGDWDGDHWPLDTITFTTGRSL